MRWLLAVILVAWIVRLLDSRRAPARRAPASEFHPEAADADPASGSAAADHPAFSSGEIVDGDFEELPGPDPR